ncbi:Tll0287-like domain-containing protein [Thiorhodospira sibirica]|uniref:Tll0287-like domain-containing protein n=1 Tax=Thiorhodospira sibirica TaxID=154347 RepID=UPI00022C22A9|nr:DUF3365 domain-containing protein [Thiorhodospira sibirica]
MQTSLRILCLFALCCVSPLKASEHSEHLQASQAVVQAFAQQLMTQLQTAVQSQGPVQAIEICHTQAPKIAQALSEETGLLVTRVSLKPRNPDSVPRPWQQAVLKDFEARLAAGENPQDLEYTKLRRHLWRSEFRYMKAIPTIGLCLNCHGSAADLAPEISEILATLYPADQAVDYTEGQIRGAFSVVQRIR